MSYSYTPVTRILRSCSYCGTEFLGAGIKQVNCSKSCTDKKYWHSKGSKARTTKSTYDRNNGRFDMYFKSLVSRSNRKQLSAEDLLEIYFNQNGKCALTGIDLTCYRSVNYPNPTNASIDRIKAGGEYTKDNIQLVCSAVNKFRHNLTVPEFIDWCRKVVNYNG